MMRLSTFVIFFLLVGFFFLAMPQNSYAGIAFTPLGCCVDNNGDCLGCGPSENCAISQGECEGGFGGNFSQGEICFDTQLSSCADPGVDVGCCIITRGECQGGTTLAQCNNQEGAGWILGQGCSQQLPCLMSEP